MYGGLQGAERMKNFFAAISLVVGVVTSAAMSACVLYVDDSGSSPSSGSNSYCDSSGCYTCDTAGTCKCVDDSCTSTGSGSGSAFSCTTDSQCAQGCYCDSATSTCAESGFCTMDSDCSGGTNGVTGSGPAAGGNGTEPPLGAPALVTIVELPVGSALCPDGGVEQLTGQDNGAGGGIAGDGILEPGEVTSSELNCNT